MNNQLAFSRPTRRRAARPAVPRREGAPEFTGVRSPGREEIEDVLTALPDRKDLQKLYERKVPLDQIVRLLGRRIDRRHIDELLDCEDPQGEVRRLLGSA